MGFRTPWPASERIAPGARPDPTLLFRAVLAEAEASLEVLGHARLDRAIGPGICLLVSLRVEQCSVVDSTGAELSSKTAPTHCGPGAPCRGDALRPGSGRSHRRHRGLCGLSPSGCGHPVHRRCLQPVPGSPLGCGTHPRCRRCGSPAFGKVWRAGHRFLCPPPGGWKGFPRSSLKAAPAPSAQPRPWPR